MHWVGVMYVEKMKDVLSVCISFSAHTLHTGYCALCIPYTMHSAPYTLQST